MRRSALNALQGLIAVLAKGGLTDKQIFEIKQEILKLQLSDPEASEILKVGIFGE